jgi:hypothetical protein
MVRGGALFKMAIRLKVPYMWVFLSQPSVHVCKSDSASWSDLAGKYYETHVTTTQQ